MLIDELIEKAFSDGYEYALMEQREFAYPGGMIGNSINPRLVKKPLVPRPKTVDMWAKVKSKNPADWSKTRESALKAASQAKSGKVIDPMAAERAKVLVSSPRISRPAPYPRQAQRAAGNPFNRASQFLSGPGGMR